MQVVVGLFEELWVGAAAEAGQQRGVGALAMQSDGAVRRSQDDTHARSLACKVQDVQHLMHALRNAGIAVMRQNSTRTAQRAPDTESADQQALAFQPSFCIY